MKLKVFGKEMVLQSLAYLIRIDTIHLLRIHGVADPFLHFTNFEYNISNDTFVSVVVYDISGQIYRSFLMECLPIIPGIYLI